MRYIKKNNLWVAGEVSIYKVRTKSECKSGEGKYLSDLSADKKLCKMRGNYFIFTRCATLGVMLTHQLICIWTKKEPKSLSLS